MDTNKKNMKKKTSNKQDNKKKNINKSNAKLAKTKKDETSNVISLNRKFDGKNLIYTPKLRNIFIVIIIIHLHQISMR